MVQTGALYLCPMLSLSSVGHTPPGFTRNITFALLGALAPMGFWCGSVIGSIFGQLVNVGWNFWFTFSPPFI
ncbi:hypothetical protein IAS59_006590 [Cryptococcus gattii]